MSRKLLTGACFVVSGDSIVRLLVKARTVGLSILSNIVLVRHSDDFSNLFVVCFFQGYAPLHCHQLIYFHFSQILPVLNLTTVSKYNRQICKASVSLAKRACILFTELSISFNMSP